MNLRRDMASISNSLSIICVTYCMRIKYYALGLYAKGIGLLHAGSDIYD